ncbi:MAG TPA: phosphate ABC transporter permease subunit PstC [Moraxellaceae bacterium]|nr:phosphate ABC transporter permease subunit PstC [Moraxellaceae bacterium]
MNSTNVLARVSTRLWPLSSERGRDRGFQWLVATVALMVLAVLGAIMLTLLTGGLPVFAKVGPGFLTGREWDPVSGHFGALPAIYGTLVTSFIALLIAVPVSFFIAFFITELCPARLRGAFSGIIELLAGIPSIIYGMWGLFVLAPLLADHVQPFLQQHLGKVPVLGQIFQGPPIGIGLLPAALILAIMVVPFITSVMREVFAVVPSTLKEAGYGLGATTWEVVWDIVLPHTRVALIGGIMLGLGRALGETMAVTFLIGNANSIDWGLFNSGNSISSVIANEFAESSDPLHFSALMGLGLILFVIAFLVLAGARLLINKSGKV